MSTKYPGQVMSGNLENEYSKVDLYEEDVPSPRGANLFAPRSSKCGPRFQMIAFLLIGIAMVLLHHILFAYLNQKPTDSSLFAVWGFSLRKQSMVSILGNTIAYAARVAFSAATGVAFIQILWSRIRRGRYTVAHIDALVACKGTPFTVKAYLAWRHAPLLAITASMASLMAFISILAPGSLRIFSAESISYCSVPTVALGTSDIVFTGTSSNDTLHFLGSKSQLMKLAGRVLMSGEPLPPRNPCPNVLSFKPCRYILSFNAPVADCTPLNLGTDLSVVLPPTDEHTGRLTVWNVSSSVDGIHFVAASRSLMNVTPAAVNCATYNGTYTVAVLHSDPTSSTAIVLKTGQIGPINASDSQTVNAHYNAISTVFANALRGTVEVDTHSDDGIYFGDNFLVGYSPAFAGTSRDTWSPTGDLAGDIASFMQNISVSLLSGQLLAMGDTVTTSVNTTCWYPASIYDYDQMQLFATYGAALGVTAICVLFGFRAIRQNGVEESFSFSRLVGAILNETLFVDRYQLTEGSQLTAVGNEDGHLRLVHTAYS